MAFADAQQTPKSHSHDSTAGGAGSSQKLSAEVQPAVETVERFSAKLKAGDLQAVESLLDPDVLILESGGARRYPRGLSLAVMEHSRFLGHHKAGTVCGLMSSMETCRRFEAEFKREAVGWPHMGKESTEDHRS